MVCIPITKPVPAATITNRTSQAIIDTSEYIGSTPRFRLFCGFWMCFAGIVVGVVGGAVAGCTFPSRVCFIGCAIAFLGYCGFLVGLFSLLIGRLPWEWRQWLNENEKQSQSEKFHSGEIVPRKYLTSNSYWGTLIDMANVLPIDKQIAVIGALTEGSSIRSIERITGVHRDTIMRLGVKVGQGCAKMLDTSMRNLPCNRLEMDEIWGFVGKKDRNVHEGDDAVGSVWTFCAIDAETKLVPAFKVGGRDAATAKAFVQDIADRMAYRVQISTDGLTAYVAAMESAFGGNVDYAQIIKTYGHEEVSSNRRYSAPEFVSSEKKVVVGNPDQSLISTSYIERLNATTRLHMRRLTRLTLAFSKKRENFEAAVALHFAYYNFVKRHSTIRCTPAMAAGVTGSFWGVGDLIEAAA
jgi:IS1 family transposase